MVITLVQLQLYARRLLLTPDVPGSHDGDMRTQLPDEPRKIGTTTTTTTTTAGQAPTQQPK